MPQVPRSKKINDKSPDLFGGGLHDQRAPRRSWRRGKPPKREKTPPAQEAPPKKPKLLKFREIPRKVFKWIYRSFFFAFKWIRRVFLASLVLTQPVWEEARHDLYNQAKTHILKPKPDEPAKKNPWEPVKDNKSK
jgi:hypothetical protein